MKTTSFIYDGGDLPAKLDSFKGEILALVYETSSSKQVLKELYMRLREKFNKPYIVLSSAPLSVSDGEYVKGINVIIFNFEKTRLNYQLVYDMNNFKKTIYELIEKDTKAFLIVSDGYIELEDISGDLELFSDYHFFGTLGNKSLAFTFDAKDNGMVIVSFSGDLEIHSYDFTKYIGIGRYHKVTKVDGSRLYEIDGKSAIEYYKNIFKHQAKLSLDFIKHFPLINKRIGEELTYVPFKIYNDGSFEMPARFLEGDLIRASYLSAYEVEKRYLEALEDMSFTNIETILTFSSIFKHDHFNHMNFKPIEFFKQNGFKVNGVLDEIEVCDDNGIPRLSSGTFNVVTLAENEKKYDFTAKLLDAKFYENNSNESILLDGIYYLTSEFEETKALLEKSNFHEKDEKSRFIDPVTGLYNQAKLASEMYSHQEEYNITYVKFTHHEFLKTIYGNNFIANIRKVVVSETKKALGDNLKLYACSEGYLIASQIDPIKHREIIEKIHKNFFKYGYQFEGEIIDTGLVYSTVFKGSKHPIINAKRGVEKAISNHSEYYEYGTSNNYLFELKEGFDQYSLVNKAYKNNLFKVAYQGIYDVKQAKITRYEALIRIVDLGRIYNPSEFLDIAYQYGYSRFMTKFVVEEVFKKCLETKNIIQVNIRRRDIEDDELFEYAYSLFSRYNLVDKIVIEILEDDNIIIHHKCLERLKILHNLGVKIAIDDFGVGYANVNYFGEDCFDFIKIAGELVKDLASDNITYRMIDFIVKTAKNFNLKVIAEYCENEEAASLLKELGVDYIQGFYYSIPSTNLLD